jgi:hypothetical protein
LYALSNFVMICYPEKKKYYDKIIINNVFIRDSQRREIIIFFV